MKALGTLQLLFAPLLFALALHGCDTPPAEPPTGDASTLFDAHVGADSGASADSAADGATLSDAGGDARGLDQQPTGDAAEYPATGWIAFESYREQGRSEIYLMRADGSDVRRLTTEGGMVPRFSPDGRWIAYEFPADHSTHLIKPDGTGHKVLHSGKPWLWMSDGSGVLVEVGADFFLVDPDDGTATLFFSRGDFTKLENKMLQPSGITGDGRYLVAGSDRYREGFTGDNGSFKASFAAIVFDLQDKSKLYYFGNGCAPRAAPAGEWIYHVRGDGDTKPDIYRMKVTDLATRASYQPVIDYADAEWGHTYFPSISNDNQWLVFGASTGCHDQTSCDYEIFIHRLDAPKNQRRRLTVNPANDRHPSLYVGALNL